MATSGGRRTYLFLLREPSAATRKEAYAHLRALGLVVPIQHGNTALEVLATPEEAAAAAKSPLFSAGLKGTMKKEHLEKLTPAHRQIVVRWNERVTEPGRAVVKRRTLAGRSWGDPELTAPAPYTAIDPAAFRDLVRRFELEPRAGTAPAARLEGAAYETFERTLTSKYDDPKLAGHLAKLSLRLPPEYQEVLMRLPAEAVRELSELAGLRGQGGK
jgi:hypothetical protein